LPCLASRHRAILPAEHCTSPSGNTLIRAAKVKYLNLEVMRHRQDNVDGRDVIAVLILDNRLIRAADGLAKLPLAHPSILASLPHRIPAKEQQFLKLVILRHATSKKQKEGSPQLSLRVAFLTYNLS
jgi:hypothetical protein